MAMPRASAASRAEFDVALRTFFTTFDTVLPRPEALPIVEDVNLFGEIQVRTRWRYRTPRWGLRPLQVQREGSASD